MWARATPRATAASPVHRRVDSLPRRASWSLWCSSYLSNDRAAVREIAARDFSHERGYWSVPFVHGDSRSAVGSPPRTRGNGGGGHALRSAARGRRSALGSGHPRTGRGAAGFVVPAETSGFDAIGFTDHPSPSANWIERDGEGVADPDLRGRVLRGDHGSHPASHLAADPAVPQPVARRPPDRDALRARARPA